MQARLSSAMQKTQVSLGYIKTVEGVRLECSSVVEHLPGRHETLRSNPQYQTEKRQTPAVPGCFCHTASIQDCYVSSAVREIGMLISM